MTMVKRYENLDLVDEAVLPTSFL